MSGAPSRVRIDVWLWRARFFKTRSLAATAVCEGFYLERGGLARRVDKPATLVEPGDGLSFRCGPGMRSVKIAALGDRRGPAAEARLLYEESADALDDEGDGGHPDAFSKDNERS